jgi:hypothetical protein
MILASSIKIYVSSHRFNISRVEETYENGQLLGGMPTSDPSILLPECPRYEH